MFLRSKAVPIQLHWVLNSYPERTSLIMDSIAQHSHKIQGLIVDIQNDFLEASDHSTIPTIPLLLGNTFVRLKVLEIRGALWNRRSYGKPQIPLLTGPFPALDKLMIRSEFLPTFFQASHLPQLSQLHLFYLNNASSHATWRDFPMFTHLEYLHWQITYSLVVQRHTPSITFPRLRVLATTSLGAYYFLSSFHAPVLERVEIIPPTVVDDLDTRAVSIVAKDGILRQLKSFTLSTERQLGGNALDVAGTLLFGLPELQEIVVTACNPSTIAILRLLAELDSASNAEASAEDVPKFSYCPNLSRLEIINARAPATLGRLYDPLIAFVKARTMSSIVAITVNVECGEQGVTGLEDAAGNGKVKVILDVGPWVGRP